MNTQVIVKSNTETLFDRILCVMQELINDHFITKYRVSTEINLASEHAKLYILQMTVSNDYNLLIHVQIPFGSYKDQIMKKSSSRISYLCLDNHCPISTIQRLFKAEIKKRRMGIWREERFLKILKKYQQQNTNVLSVEKAGRMEDINGVDFIITLNTDYSLSIPIQVKGSILGIKKHESLFKKIPALMVNYSHSDQLLLEQVGKIVNSYINGEILHLY